MNLIQKTAHHATARTVLTEAEILRILTEAVASKAGISLDDANVTVSTQYLSRSTRSLTSEFSAVIEIVRDLSAPASSPATGEMINRFLSWRLPESVCTDPVCSKPGAGQHERTGTMLLTHEQAAAMLDHVLNGERATN